MDDETRAAFANDTSIDEMADRAARESLWVLSYFTTLVIQTPGSTVKHALKHVRFPDMSLVRKYYDEGRAVVIVSPHISASFLIPIVFAMHGFRVTMVEDLIHSDEVRRLAKEWTRTLSEFLSNDRRLLRLYRKHNPQAHASVCGASGADFDLELLGVSHDSLKHLSDHLYKGRIVVLFNDYRHLKNSSELTDELFGTQACVARGAASLVAQHDGVAFGCAITKQNDKMTMSLGHPLMMSPGQEIDDMAIILFRESRKHIHSMPSQWTLWPKVTSHLKA